MALNSNCSKCGQLFIHGAGDGRFLCRRCDGTEAHEQAEEQRWAALTPDQKCDELRKMVKGLRPRSCLDGLIG